MFSNKVTIGINSLTRTGSFDGKLSARSFLRYKNGVLYTKLLSKTTFLAALGHKRSRVEIQKQASDAMTQLSAMVDAHWGEGTAARIGLDTFGQQGATVRVLSGRTVGDLSVHAAAAAELHALGGLYENAADADRDAALRNLKDHINASVASNNFQVKSAANHGAVLYAIEQTMRAAAGTALDDLGLREQTTAADREATIQTIQGFMTEALKSAPGVQIEDAARQGAFRYALLQHYKTHQAPKKNNGTYQRDPGEFAKSATNRLLTSKRYKALDQTTLLLAQRTFGLKGNCDPEMMHTVEMTETLATASIKEAQNLLQEQLRIEVENTSKVGDAFRSNSAISAVMVERSRSPDMTAVTTAMIDALMSSELKDAVKRLDKQDQNHKNQLAEQVGQRLPEVLRQVPPERLPLKFCQDVQLGLNAIEAANVQANVDKEQLKSAWFANAFALRLLCPPLKIYGQNPDADTDAATSTAVSAGLQKLVNSPALNSAYLAYMNAVAERGKATD